MDDGHCRSNENDGDQQPDQNVRPRGSGEMDGERTEENTRIANHIVS